MDSIGNDVVDLHFIDAARTRSFSFYSKILSQKEQHLYPAFPQPAMPFENYVWVLWSAKEAVYKFLKRHQPGLIFSPVRLEALSLTFSAGHNADGKTYASSIFIHPVNPDSNIFCHSTIAAGYIHTLASASPDVSGVLSAVNHIDNADHTRQSQAVRQLVLGELRSLFPGASLTFAKAQAGYPVVLANGKETGIILSFSHHGNYVAYAMCRP